MNWQVSVPWTVCSDWGHWKPWKRRPISLHMARVHLGPLVDLESSLYSAWVPVSGFMAVPLKAGVYQSGLVLGRVLLRGPSLGATPRGR